jgi:hypothetical protein
MSLVLQSSGGGSVTLEEPTTASNFTITVPAVTGTMATVDGSGNASVTGNLSFNSGYGSSAVGYGCRAWVSFNGNPVSIRGSGNVSSITDGGVGIYTVNFTTAMPDANYGIAVASEAGGGSGNKGPYINSPTTGSLGVFVYNGSGSLVDASPVNVAIFR